MTSVERVELRTAWDDHLCESIRAAARRALADRDHVEWPGDASIGSVACEIVDGEEDLEVDVTFVDES